MNEPLCFQPLQLPAARCVVYFTRIGAREPAIDARSLFAALGMGWDRWHACAMAVALQHGLQLRLGRDVNARMTRLVWFSQVPRLLEAMEPVVELLHPAAARRIARLRVGWGSKWGQSVAPEPIPPAVNAGEGKVDATGGPTAGGAPHRLVMKPPVVRITREVEAQVLSLASAGLSGAEIARRLNISPASVCLLKAGKFRFAASELARPQQPLPSSVPGRVGRRRSGRPVITHETESLVTEMKGLGKSLSQIATELNISAASASLLARGKYQFSSHG